MLAMIRERCLSAFNTPTEETDGLIGNMFIQSSIIWSSFFERNKMREMGPSLISW